MNKVADHSDDVTLESCSNLYLGNYRPNSSENGREGQSPTATYVGLELIRVAAVCLEGNVSEERITWKGKTNLGHIR
jgi:hypothetical protein